MEQEIKLAFLSYLESYLEKRDFDATIRFISPNITGFGTGLDEKAYDYQTCLRLYHRDINQVRNPIDYSIENLHIYSPYDNIGIVCCELNIESSVLDHSFKINHLRLSLIFVRDGERWFIEHFHISLPTSIHNPGEAFPIKEIEDQHRVVQKLVSEETEKFKKILREVEKQATIDGLTQLYNRVKIEEIITNEIEKAKDREASFSVILIDVDHFKRVNDEFGHLMGDKFLIEFANILLKNTREIDICGRWGGEEFIVFSPNTNLEQALLIAERLRKVIEDFNFPVVGHKTASFGVACCRKNDSLKSIIERADIALYASKRSGRNKVSFQ
ncbi:MAG: diguanylate cyclase [Syntrophobacterales bacterium]|nr:diguanylate cyclase [Syntrophobacterales bacterium]